jgi:para-nitrobenzyl esterase
MHRKCLAILGQASQRIIAALVCVVLIAAVKTAWGQAANTLLSDPIVTDAGLVSGATIGEPGKEVRIYRGIPYAAPPLGKLRWAPPQPVTPWKGIRESTSFGPWATQFYPTMHWMGGIPESQMSEDCLHLNVITPARTAKDKLPVMVWIHPGGLDAGSGNQRIFNTPYLSQHGVVLVTVVSRLGGMGYLAHPEMAAESPHHAAGNYGMLDLIASLQWVKQNIAAFGGDPDCVTIFGQSGGAGKIMWLMASPLAKGLFHRAIVEAGTFAVGDAFVSTMDKLTPQTDAEKVGEKLASKLGAKNLDELRAKPWQEIVNALPKPQVTSDLNMLPTIDGWSMPDTPFNLTAKGQRNDVPLLIGGGEGETTLRRAVTLYAPGLLKGKSNTYAYTFTHVPANWKRSGLISYHGEELSYEFGDLSAIPGDWSTLIAPTYPKDPGLTHDDEVVSENIIKMWIQFARTGDPSVPGLIKAEPLKPGPGGDQYIDISVKPQMKAGYYLGEPTL